MKRRFDLRSALFQTSFEALSRRLDGVPDCPSSKRDSTKDSQFEIVALAQWESEGGAVAGCREADRSDGLNGVALSEAAYQQLHVRIIALESVLISLMAEAPLQQRSIARSMAEFILPRHGYTAHPVTIRAAAEILSLADRAERISVSRPPQS